MKIKRYRYEALLANEDRLAVMQDILNSDRVSRSYPDMEDVFCILGLDARRYRQKKEALEEADRQALLEYRARQEEEKENGDTV